MKNILILSIPTKQDKDAISEHELLKSIIKAQKEYNVGKSIKAKSMADLIE